MPRGPALHVALPGQQSCTSPLQRPSTRRLSKTDQSDIYFLAAAASSALSFARFSRLPEFRLSARESRSFRYAPPSIALGMSLFLISEMPVDRPVMGKSFLTMATSLSAELSWLLAAATSSLLASPCLCWPSLRGKRIRRARYALRRATFWESDSCDRFWRRESTEIPIVGANLRGIPASCMLGQREFSHHGQQGPNSTSARDNPHITTFQLKTHAPSVQRG